MEKILHIGIIDEDFSGKMLEKCGTSLQKVLKLSLLSGGEMEVLKYSFEESVKSFGDSGTGHGDAILCLVHQYNPTAIFTIISIGTRAPSSLLPEALQLLLDEGVDTVVMSVGTGDSSIAPLFYEITKRALRRGVIIFTAATGELSYPAAFDTVIPVANEGLFEGYVHPHIAKNIGIILPERNVSVWYQNQIVSHSMSTSYACAMVNHEVILSLYRKKERCIQMRLVNPERIFLSYRREDVPEEEEADLLLMGFSSLSMVELLKFYAQPSITIFEREQKNFIYRLLPRQYHEKWSFAFCDVPRGKVYLALLVHRLNRKVMAFSCPLRMEDVNDGEWKISLNS